MEKSDPLALEDAQRLLGQCALFRGLQDSERSALVARAHVRKFTTGQNIFLMDSAGDRLMAVLSRNVGISVPSAEGKEIVLAILRPGEVLGEIAVLDGQGRTADAQAMTECSLALLYRRDVLSFFERHPDAWPRLGAVPCERPRATGPHTAGGAPLGFSPALATALPA